MEKFYEIFFSISLVFSVLYFLCILFYIIGWKNLETPKPINHPFTTFLSIIIPARNEEQYIENCIQHLLTQNYPKTLYEIIVIDDHSNDNTCAIASRYSSGNFHVLQLSSSSLTIAFKKRALQEAIQKAKGQLIITTDADCIMGKNWLSSIASQYEASKSKMIVGPVSFMEGNSFFAKMQSLEFISLIGSAGASLYYNKPLMCNGANLAFEKEAFLSIEGYESHKNIATGDDILLMHELSKRFPNSITFLKSEEAIVQTYPKKNLLSFWEQRKRWVSKSKHYTDSFVIAISLLVYINNILPLLSSFLSFIYPKFIFVFLACFFLKSLVDYVFLKQLCKFFKTSDLMKLFFPVQLAYLVYVSLVGIVGNIQSYAWKERKYKD